MLRSELRKYMRKIKRSDPTAACFIQYDKLYVNNKIFVFNDLQGKVGKVYWFMNLLLLWWKHLIKLYLYNSLLPRWWSRTRSRTHWPCLLPT